MNPAQKIPVYCFLALALLVSFLAYFTFDPGFHAPMIASFAGLGVLSYFVVVIFKRLAGQRFEWFGIFNLFAFGFVIVHFQYPILSVFEEEVATNAWIWRYWDISTEAMLVGVIGFLCFLFGYVLKFGHISPKERTKPQTPIGPVEYAKVFYTVFGMAVLSFAGFLAIVGPAYLQGAYAGTSNWGGGATYAFVAFEIFFNLALALEIYRMRMENRHRGILGYLFGFNYLLSAFAVAYVLFNIYTGDRGPIIVTGIIVLGGYDMFFRRMGAKFFIPLIVFGALVLTFVGHYRTRDTTLSIEERIEQAVVKGADKKYYSYTADLAGNVRNLNTVVAMVPEQYPYFKGMIMGGGVLQVIPLYQKILNPTIGQWRVGITSGQFNTFVTLGEIGNYGVGTTVVADAYLDFGIFSVIVIFCGMGYFMAWLETTGPRNFGIYRTVLCILVLSYALYWPRASVFGAIDEWVWSLGIIWVLRTKVFQKISQWRRRRRRHGAAEPPMLHRPA